MEPRTAGIHSPRQVGVKLHLATLKRFKILKLAFFPLTFLGLLVFLSEILSQINLLLFQQIIKL